MRIFKLLLSTVVIVSIAFTAYSGTLEDVKARGELRCVTSTGVAGFS